MSSDKLYINCPACPCAVEITTYSGPCENIDFCLDDAPLKIIAEVNEESRNERIQCQSCGMHIALVVRHMAYEMALSDAKMYSKKWRKS